MDAFAAWLAPFLSDGSILALPLVMLGGLITAFNPCCLPMYPAVFGVIGGTGCGCGPCASEQNPEVVAKPLTGITLMFVFGMATATAIMGVLTAGLGWVFGRFDTIWILLLAAVPLLMGLHLLGWLPLRLPNWHSQRLGAVIRRRLGDKFTAYGAGLAFSLAVAPCTTPILLGILTLVAMHGRLLYGGFLMFFYGVGAGLPLLLIGHGLSRLQKNITPTRQKTLQRLSGILLIGVCFFILWQL